MFYGPSINSVGFASFWMLIGNGYMLLSLHGEIDAPSGAKKFAACVTFVSLCIAFGYAISPHVSVRDLEPMVLVFSTFIANLLCYLVAKSMDPRQIS